ncbi:MAG: signal peptidase II [Chlamydiales bacterium]
MKKWVAIFVLLLVLDIGTKIAAIHWVPYLSYGPYPFGGFGIFSCGGVTCSLNYIINTGAAWGVFGGHPGWLFAIRGVIILALLLFVPKRLPIWLVLTGAVGNAIDYCLYGHVIDFFHFTFWGYSFPIFNIADACITIGILSLFLFPAPLKKIQVL